MDVMYDYPHNDPEWHPPVWLQALMLAALVLSLLWLPPVIYYVKEWWAWWLL
jgi:hypothetical protein